MPQNVLLQQPALQAALAAQCMAAQTQSKSSIPPQSQRTSSGSPSQGNKITAPSENILPQDEKVASQELSVAQMMMTLARASNKNTLAHNGGDSTQQATPDGNSK